MFSTHYKLIGVHLLMLLSSSYAVNMRIANLTRCPNNQNNIAVLMDDFNIFCEKDTFVINGHFNLTDIIENSLEVRSLNIIF